MADLPNAVREALEAMPWLTTADAAAVELAKQYAEQITAGVERGGQDATKALYLGPHLLGVLTALGGTPKGRKELELKEQAGASKLDNIRALRDASAPTKKRTRSA